MLYRIKSCLPTIICIYVILGIILLFIPNKNRHGSGTSSRQKACYSNIRVIQGAIEMYNMDSSSIMDDCDIDKLIDGNYLKERPVLPEKSCSYSAHGKMSGEGQVVCAYHGGMTIEGKYDNPEIGESFFGKCISIIIAILAFPALLIAYLIGLSVSFLYNIFH